MIKHDCNDDGIKSSSSSNNHWKKKSATSNQSNFIERKWSQSIETWTINVSQDVYDCVDESSDMPTSVSQKKCNNQLKIKRKAMKMKPQPWKFKDHYRT